MKNSDQLTKGSKRAPHRSLLYSLGLEKEDFDKPFIGIANSFNETIPGHKHLRSVVEAVKEGIYKAGGIPFEFNTIGVCDGLAMNHKGMSYSLTSRQLICDTVVVQARGFAFDGLVFIPNCDKIVPGMLMAAAVLDMPSIFISGGPMLSGNVDGVNVGLSEVFEAVGKFEAKKITEEKLEEYEEKACPTCGSCSGMYTANTMNCLSEVLGIALPGNGTIPAVYSARQRLYKKAGRTIIDLVAQNKTFSQIVNRNSFMNAIACDMAMTGSTNTILHLLAIAKYAGIDDVTLETFDEVSKKVKQLTKLSPASKVFIEDFDAAGGVYALLNELRKDNLLIDNPTVLNDSLFDSIKDAKIKDFDIIRPFDSPYDQTSGLTILKGNIAKTGAVIKTGAIKKSQYYFKGTAKVFENEDTCVDYLMGDEIQKNSVIVIRNMGIKGGYGMPEMLTPTSLIKGKKIDEEVALITDGRFSGGSNGLVIGHITPEASEFGVIGIIQDGDEIEINIETKQINLLVDESIIIARLAKYTPVILKSNDYLDRYTENATNASLGGHIEK